ncbi:MAG TPA: hypothetical protein VL992_00510, partial [Tepidisphaeraceae bacterium]|nr:hypothetical protein [Tepidisphaeraceae bacterium]
MTRFERKLLKETSLIGILATVLAVWFDTIGIGPFNATGLRLALSDYRARHFQYFRPPPTKQLVHLDIDDTTLSAVGRWPWP